MRDMEPPSDPQAKRPSYWIRGLKTPRHTYFYPSDDRAGVALMLLIGILGLIALCVAVRNILGTPQIHQGDLVLAVIGFLTSATGLYQASRLRHWR